VLAAQLALSADVFARPDPALWGEVAANLMPFEPVIDGDVLPTRPIDRIAEGAGAEIEVLIGTTTEEERLFLVPNDAIKAINEDILAGGVAAYGLPVSETLATYRATRPAANAGDIYEAIYTDWFFRIPAVRLAEAHVRNNGRLICTSLPGARPRLMGGWARATPWRYRSFSTRSPLRVWRCSWEKLRRKRWPMPCTPPG